MQGWYLVRTRPMSEYFAAVTLQKNGYELFFPRVKTPCPRIGREDSPLFPGYLFVRQDLDDLRLTPINRMPGLIGWVAFDEVVPRISDEILKELQIRIEKINEKGGYWTQYRPGEKVRVISGKIDSLAEVLEEPKSPESRVNVLLEFMGRLVPSKVPWRDLQRIENHSMYVSSRITSTRRTRGKGRWIRGFGPRVTVNVSAATS